MGGNPRILFPYGDSGSGGTAADTLEVESGPRTGSFRGWSGVCYGDASNLFEHGVLHGQLWEPVYALAGRDFRPGFARAFFPAG